MTSPKKPRGLQFDSKKTPAAAPTPVASAKPASAKPASAKPPSAKPAKPPANARPPGSDDKPPSEEADAARKGQKGVWLDKSVYNEARKLALTLDRPVREFIEDVVIAELKKYSIHVATPVRTRPGRRPKGEASS